MRSNTTLNLPLNLADFKSKRRSLRRDFCPLISPLPRRMFSQLRNLTPIQHILRHAAAKILNHRMTIRIVDIPVPYQTRPHIGDGQVLSPT